MGLRNLGGLGEWVGFGGLVSGWVFVYYPSRSSESRNCYLAGADEVNLAERVILR